MSHENLKKRKSCLCHEEVTENKKLDKREKVNEESTIRLIGAVKNEPMLWNVENEFYRCFDIKNKAWEKIARKEGFTTGHEAKSEWKKLRSLLVRRRKIEHIGTYSNKLGPRKYEKEMEFLLPFISKRCTENATLHYDSRQSADELSEEEIPLSKFVNTTVPTNDTNIKMEPIEVSIIDPITCEYEENSMHSFLNEPSDALKKFFASMHDSTKSLPEPYQLQIKRKIFAAVMEAEENFLKTQISHSAFIEATNKRIDSKSCEINCDN